MFWSSNADKRTTHSDPFINPLHLVGYPAPHQSTLKGQGRGSDPEMLKMNKPVSQPYAVSTIKLFWRRSFQTEWLQQQQKLNIDTTQQHLLPYIASQPPLPPPPPTHTHLHCVLWIIIRMIKSMIFFNDCFCEYLWYFLSVSETQYLYTWQRQGHIYIKAICCLQWCALVPSICDTGSSTTSRSPGTQHGTSNTWVAL